MSRSVEIPAVKLLDEAEGHVVTVELKSGELYGGNLMECGANWDCQLENVTFTDKDGKVSQLELVFIRGSKVKARVQHLEFPRGRAITMRARAQAAGRGAAPGRGVVPPVRR